jgi:hypothetical protein
VFELAVTEEAASRRLAGFEALPACPGQRLMRPFQSSW